MRTTSILDTAILDHPARAFRTWIKVEMTRVSAHTWGSETWVDLTDLNGFDWVKGVEYGEDIDTPAWTASIKLHSHLTDYALNSLSPFLANSPNNAGGVLIQPYRKVRISTAVVPMGTPRSNATFNVVFLGRVDSWDMSPGEITVNCRDRTGELMDFMIEFERDYGAVDPTTATAADVEEVIQNILDDHYNTNTTISTAGGNASAPRASALSARDTGSGGTEGSPYHLYSATGTTTNPWIISTGFAIREYSQTKMPVWQAIQALADTIGYQLRMRWKNGVNDFVLVLEEPDRAASTADLTLDPSTGSVQINSVSLSSQDVRNVVRVSYAETGTKAASSESNDSSSITKYGRKFMEVTEGSTSQIDTSTEAGKMRDGFLTDLKEPTAAVSLSCPYLWYIQLNDYIAIDPDNFFFDSQQKLAVRGRRNVIVQGGPAMTTLTCTGQPKSGVMRHAEKQRTFIQPRHGLKLFSASGKYGRLSNGNFSSNSRE